MARKSTAAIHSGGCAEAPARASPGCYDSTVCSIEGDALRRVAEAIDRLEADRGNTDAADLEARVAAVWLILGEIDPELTRLASGYEAQLSSWRPGPIPGPAAGERGSRRP
jgi:hypothetical protein